ncbi:hypothetical protein [Shimia ponticola]|uniref:hypothetical protein n=1 Tax=Shimia ponticola TaxID=2582893 RepID=UPI0011BE22A0|nr:hypothetical protein [Shimia ponticola]
MNRLILPLIFSALPFQVLAHGFDAHPQGLSGTQLTFGTTVADVGDNSASIVELRGASAFDFGRGVSLQFDWGFFGNDDRIDGVDDTDGFKNLRLLTAVRMSPDLTLGASASYIKIEREETDSLGLHFLWDDSATRVEAIAEAFESPIDTATYLGLTTTTPLAGMPDTDFFAAVDHIDGADLDRESAQIGLRHSYSPNWALSAALTHDDQYGHTNELRVGADYSLSAGRTAHAFIGAGEDSASAGITFRYAVGAARTAPLFDLSLFSAAFR